MYSNDKIEAAVKAGALDADSAARLRSFVEADEAGAPQTDEENIRLVTSFNDIFVSIAIALVLVAAGVMGGSVLVAAACWGLAEFFTRKRRMALPSVILAVVFSASVFVLTARMLGSPSWWSLQSSTASAVAGSLILAAMGAITAAATSAYWLRFKAPVSIACATVAVAAAALGILLVIIDSAFGKGASGASLSWLSFGAGVAIFAFAMRWDASDLERLTRRSDVAFWLHLAASPLIVHPIFLNLGLVGSRGDATGAALLAVLAYVVLGAVAVIVDRRAILVSALVYVLTAMGVLLRTTTDGALGFALPAAVIGGLLLVLSAFWQPLRRSIVTRLPTDIRRRLPVVQ